jgi:hypothetical protein
MSKLPPDEWSCFVTRRYDGTALALFGDFPSP